MKKISAIISLVMFAGVCCAVDENVRGSDNEVNSAPCVQGVRESSEVSVDKLSLKSAESDLYNQLDGLEDVKKLLGNYQNKSQQSLKESDAILDKSSWFQKKMNLEKTK